MKHILRLSARWLVGTLCALLLSAGLALLALRLILMSWHEPAHLERILSIALRQPVQIEDVQMVWQGWDLLVTLQGLELTADDQKQTITADRIRLLCKIPLSLLTGRPYVAWMEADGLSLPLTGLTGGTQGHLNLIVKKARLTNGVLINDGVNGFPDRIGITELLWQHQHREMNAYVQLQPPPAHGAAWTIRARGAGPDEFQFRLHSPHVDLAAWQAAHAYTLPEHMHLQGLLSNIRVYGHRLGDKLTATGHADSDISLSRPDTDQALTVYAKTSLSALWDSSTEQQDYRLQLRQLRVAGQNWPPLNIAVDHTDQRTRLHTAHPSLPAALVMPLIHHWPSAIEADTLQLLSGMITGAHVLLTPDGSVKNATLTFEGFSGKIKNHIPQFSELKGQLSWLNDELGLEVAGGDLMLNLPLIPKYLDMRDVQGKLRWQPGVDGNSIVLFPAVTATIEQARLRLKGDLEIRHNEVYATGVLLYGLDLRVDSVLSHMPVGVPDTVKKKLMQVLPEGYVTEGRLLIRGAFNDYPFLHNDGVFVAHLLLDDTTIYTDTHWPDIDQVKGTVDLSSRDMHAQLHTGRWGPLQLNDVTLVISDFQATETYLLTGGVITGSITDIMNLQDSADTLPSGEWLIQGEAAANVSARLGPLGSDEAQVTVTSTRLTLKDNKLSEPGNPLLTITAINGELLFTNDQPHVSQLQCHWSGHPAQLTIKGCDDAKQRLCPLLTGVIDDQTIDRWLRTGIDWPLPEDWLQGTARITASYDKDGRLSVESEMDGMRVNLPLPLGKEADTVQKLDMMLGSPRDIRSALQLDYAGLQIRHDSAPPGRISVTGHIRKLDLDSWSQLITEQALSPSTITAEADLTIDDVRLLQQEYREMAVSMDMSPQTGIDLQWEADDEFSGTMTLPVSKEEAITLALSQWHISVGDETRAEQQPERWRLPQPMQITVERFHIDETNGGLLELHLEPVDDGLALRQLMMSRPGLEVHGTGSEMMIADNRNQSTVNLMWTADQMADVMALFGSTETGISGAPTQLSMDLRWAGKLHEFSKAGAGGTISFDIGAGRMEEASNSQAERLFSLLSIGKVFDRLTLDFSDLSSKGKDFDSMKGTMTLANGILSTDDMTVVSPTALMRVIGDIHIIDQEYQQQVTVIPKLTNNMTVLAALLGGLPALSIGSAAFVLDKITGGLPDQLLSNLVKKEYSITGSWDDPQIQPITRAQKPDRPENGNNSTAPLMPPAATLPGTTNTP